MKQNKEIIIQQDVILIGTQEEITSMIEVVELSVKKRYLRNLTLGEKRIPKYKCPKCGYQFNKFIKNCECSCCGKIEKSKDIYKISEVTLDED